MSLKKFEKNMIQRMKISLYIGVPGLFIIGISVAVLGISHFSELWGMLFLSAFCFGAAIFMMIFFPRYIRKLEKELEKQENDFEKYKKFYDENHKK